MLVLSEYQMQGGNDVGVKCTHKTINYSAHTHTHAQLTFMFFFLITQYHVRKDDATAVVWGSLVDIAIISFDEISGPFRWNGYLRSYNNSLTPLPGFLIEVNAIIGHNNTEL